MNQTQTKYVRQRAEAIYGRRKQKLRDEYTDPGVTYSPKEKLELLRKGLFRVNDEISQYGANYLQGYITFPEERPSVFDSEGYKVAETLLKARFEHLMDELILGDEQEALQLLKAFEND